jgi:transcriptional regulator with XRE-family HTH domain
VSTETNRSTAFIERLGVEVRRRRRAGGLTVQGLADRAGLSRRILTQIEQGTANPSLVTVDKIADALGVDFAALAAPSQTEPLHISEPVEIWRSDAGSRAVLHVASARRGGPELWEWTLQPGDHYQAEADPPGSEELILVTAGRLGRVS